MAGTGTKVVSDIRELVPSDLPALQSLTELEDSTGVSAELDVLVSGDVTSPEGIAWMSDFKDRVLNQHGFATNPQFASDEGLPYPPSCLAEDGEQPGLCPGPAMSDLFDLAIDPDSDPGAPVHEQPSVFRIGSVFEKVPPYFSQAVLSQGGRETRTTSPRSRS